MNITETKINNELMRVHNLDKIVVISGRLKYYLKDLVDRNNMNVNQFLESIVDTRVFQIETNSIYYNDLNLLSSEKEIGVSTEYFEYAGSIKKLEYKILSEIVENDIAEVTYITSQNIGYYLVYLK
jgi:hypothetical protein